MLFFSNVNKMIMQKEEAAAAAKLLVTLKCRERISQNMKKRGRGAVSCRKRKVGAPSAGVEQRGSRLNFGPKPDWPEPVSFFLNNSSWFSIS